MKTKRIYVIGLGLLLIACSTFYSTQVFGEAQESMIVSSDIDVNITINKTTSDEEMDEIITMLTEHGINCRFSKVERNKEDLIISITITVTYNTSQQLSTTVADNLGINELTFGRKDGQLFIDQNSLSSSNLVFFNMPNVHKFDLDQDGLMQQHFSKFSFNFNDFFNEDGSALYGNIDSLSIDEAFKMMQSQFGKRFSSESSQRFNFVDDPNTEKLIIIDGKESDFKTLDSLSKDDKIEAVDFLKSKTAVSIYGSKAKDGAVIATTKD